jgi:transposase
MIKDTLGIKTSLSAVKRLAKKLGYKFHKSGALPAKADVVAQRTFYDDVLHPLMKMAKAGFCALLFVDASHFVLGGDYRDTYLGPGRRFVKTYSGRKRYNVLGALNFVSKQFTTVTDDNYISAIQVCELFMQIAFEYVGMPVYLVLDNARYQKCKVVQELAANLNINLVYIPPYSPNLNLIERFWKHVKKRLRTKVYEDFNEFCERINSILGFDDGNDKKALESLITEKVQLFDDLVLINDSTFASGVAVNKAA